MRERVSEMTNHGAKASALRAIPQGNRIVCDHQKDPVCLDAIPGAHKHFGKAEMLFDVLVEEFDREAIGVETHHFGFGHVEIVGNKKPAFSSFELGDKDQHQPDSREKDFFLGDLKPLLFGDANGFVFPRSLCQVTRRNLFAVRKEETISFDRTKKSPACLLNRVEDRGAGIPDIHDHGQSTREEMETFFENCSGQFDFAFEGIRSTAFLGAVAANGPSQTLLTGFENRCYGTQATNRSMDAVMDSNSLDMLAVSGTRRIVENQARFFGIDSLCQVLLVFFLQTLGSLCRMLNEMMKALGVLAQLRGNFPDRSEFDQRNQSEQINQKVLSLRLRQNLQEMSKIGRNLFRELFSHGFRVLRLRGLVSIGDFGRKPFCF